jgi:acetyl esterase/lipase
MNKMINSELNKFLGIYSRYLNPSMRDVTELRNNFEKMIIENFNVPQDAIITPEIINENLQGEYVIAPGAKKNKVILYFHGGAYVIGSCKTHRRMAYNLSRATNFKVFTVDYRLAPEHPFPAAFEDCLASYKWLTQNGFDPKDIVLAGDSAGAALAISTMVSLRNDKMPLPLALVALCPWIDLELSGDSIITKAKIDPILTKDELSFCAELLFDKKIVDYKNPRPSPLYEDLSSLSPFLIQVGSSDVLLDDSIRLAKKLEDGGVKVRLNIWNNMIHGWHLFDPIFADSKKAIEEIAVFINELLENNVEPNVHY